MKTRSASSLLRSATAGAAAVGLSAAGLWTFFLAGAGSLTAVRASGPDAAEDLLGLGAAGVDPRSFLSTKAWRGWARRRIRPSERSRP